MKKVGACGRTVYYVTGQPFSALHFAKSVSTSLPHEGQNLKQNQPNKTKNNNKTKQKAIITTTAKAHFVCINIGRTSM